MPWSGRGGVLVTLISGWGSGRGSAMPLPPPGREAEARSAPRRRTARGAALLLVGENQLHFVRGGAPERASGGVVLRLHLLPELRHHRVLLVGRDGFERAGADA